MNPCCACGRLTPFTAPLDHKKYHCLPYCAQCQAREAGRPFVTSTVRFPPEVRYKGKVLPDNMKFGGVAPLVDPNHPITRDPEWGPTLAKNAEICERYGRLQQEYRKRRGQKEDAGDLETALNGVKKERAQVWEQLDAILARWVGQKSVARERLARLRDWFCDKDTTWLHMLQGLLGIDNQAFEMVVLPRAKALGALVNGRELHLEWRNGEDSLLAGFNQTFIELERAEHEQAARGIPPRAEKPRADMIVTEALIRAELAPEATMAGITFDATRGEVTVLLGPPMPANKAVERWAIGTPRHEPALTPDAIQDIATYIEAATGWRPILKKNIA